MKSMIVKSKNRRILSGLLGLLLCAALLACLPGPVRAATGVWTAVGTKTGFSAGYAGYTSIALDNSGTPYVAYLDGSVVSYSTKATVMKFNGTSWETVGTAGFSAGAAEYISLALDSGGIPYVAYPDGANSTKATVMKFNGASWETVGTAGFSGCKVYEISLVLDGSTPYVAYNDNDMGGDHKLTVKKFNGTNWETVGTAGFSAGGASGISLALDSSGTPYVAYGDMSHSYKATVMKYNGTSWVTVGTAGFSAGDAGFISLALDGGGAPYVAYRDSNADDEATVMKYSSGSWETVGSAGFSTGGAYYTSLALYGGGAPYVAYAGAGTSGFTVMKYNGAGWETVGMADQGGMAEYTSLALDGSGTPYVAYQHQAMFNKAMVMKFGSGAAKTLTADSSDNDLDHNIVITFDADSTFESVITGVSFNGIALTASTDYTVGSGTLTLIPGGAITAPATGNVVITATGYDNSSVSQTVNAGAVASLSVSTQPAPGAGSGTAFATQPAVTLKDRFSNTCSSGPSASANVTASARAGSGSWTIGGAATVAAANGVATFTDLTCTPVAAGIGYITFSTGAATVDSSAFTIPGNGSGSGSGDATLSGLTVSEGPLSPAFAAATTGYAVSVKNSVESITITPTVNETHATVKVNDAAVVSGSSSGAVSLNVGLNTITVVVTAQDNTTRTYLVTVTRAAADLSGSWELVGSAGLSAGQTANTSIAVDNNGTPYVVYKDYGQSGKATVMKYTGTSWETVGSAGFSAGSAGYTSIALDRSVTPNVPYVVYEDAVKYKATVMKYTGTSWETVGSTGFSAGEANYTSIVVDKNGTPYVAYKDLTNWSGATVMKYNGTSWETVGSAGFSSGKAEYVTIALDGSGTPYVAYVDLSNYKATAMKYNGTSWETVGSAGFSAGSVVYTSIALDNSGVPYVVYRDKGNSDKATVMKYTGAGSSGWEPVGSAGFSAGAVDYTSIVLDGSGVPYIVYKDYSKSAKATVMKYNGTNWATMGSAGFSAGLAEHLSIALDSSGTPYVVYKDGGNGDKATVMKFTVATLSGDATLSNLEVSAGTLSPVFNQAATGYAVSVDNSVSSITVTPTVSENHATVIVNGSAVVSGSSSSAINLNVGANTITIEVTAQDNTTKTYTVTVTRAAAVAAALTLTATGGNGSVILGWTPAAGAVNYAVYKSSVSGSYGEALATVNGTLYGYTATGLTNGAIYYFMVKALDSSGNITSSNEAQAIPHVTGGGSGGSGGGSGGGSNNSSSGSTAVIIRINGVEHNMATATTTKVDNRNVITVVPDDSQINAKLENERRGSVITIPVSGAADVVTGRLNGQTLKNMENKESVLEIATGQINYTVPASMINIDKVSSQIGTAAKLKDITVNISISNPPAGNVKVIKDNLDKNSYQMVASPVEFTITCASGDKTVDVSRFNGYVERTIAMPDGVDPGKITTALVVNPDGSFYHVPTAVELKNGKYYAKINSLTDSTYSVIWNPLEFKDAAGHWAKEAVNDMGSRLVISGVSKDIFEPDRDITRAEFAAIIVRALGLKPGTGSNRFSDVTDTTWYGDYVKTASEYKIISGYGNGQFGPDDRVTREQALSMIARAMSITRLKADLAAGEADKLLAKFNDANQAADYAKNSIAACVKAGIISGRSATELAPAASITRAETAVMIRTLLKKSNLI